MEYLSIKQISERWELSPRRIQVLCANGRIDGAVRIGYAWAIPSDAEKPSDAPGQQGEQSPLRGRKALDSDT